MDNLQHFRNKQKMRFEELTEREIEVFTLIARGMNNPAIAEELGISRATVQNHRSQIRCKLNVRNQVELTDREIEILQLLADGLNNPGIAKHLLISRRTVETHRKHLNKKLHIKSYSTLVKYALAYGLIEY